MHIVKDGSNGFALWIHSMPIALVIALFNVNEYAEEIM